MPTQSGLVGSGQQKDRPLHGLLIYIFYSVKKTCDLPLASTIHQHHIYELAFLVV
jgi:hypothetical protein